MKRSFGAKSDDLAPVFNKTGHRSVANGSDGTYHEILVIGTNKKTRSGSRPYLTDQQAKGECHRATWILDSPI